ncbi:superoxide dismutase [Brasilonema bromeliae]|uniref:Superoxide dismutase n=1 Tax=Brasilonema bromeliae SPC951 TaxID=385972 RepID=A0ABX1P4T4_9CYAN|nr:superoxide dismutase [Brasilonema bromeliae]NMG19023.1 superoxide dismutase [Fe] [Brasilonema bromeliae SPC951]
MAFELPPLPYDYDALSPLISSDTLKFHHDKHHAGYVTNLNKLIEGTELANKSLEEIVLATVNDSAKTGIFNNAAQVWNHTFYWHGLKKGAGAPSGELAEKINASFGSLDEFKKQFKEAGATQFGSGYAWLVLDNGELKVVKTPNAANPITNGQTPLLTADVWEHAYYLDYQNRRPDYLDTFLNELINWDFVAEQYANAAK